MTKTLKRMIAFLLVILCAFILPSCQNESMENGIVYNNSTARHGVWDITIWAGKEVVIPAEHDGYPVVRLMDRSWLKLPSIYTTLILPETMEEIDRDFYDNASSSLQYNEYDNALYLGTQDNPYFALIKAMKAPAEGAEEMSYKVSEINTVDKQTPATPPYESDRSDVRSCKIHPDTKIIAQNAFEGCSYLKSITIPGSIKVIPSYAFGGCSALEAVVIEEGVEKIDYSAFEGCYNLTSISLPSTLQEADGVFYDLTKLETVDIPEGWTKIPDYMFINCVSLKNVSIPSTVTEIGDGTFENCSSLTQIIFPEGLRSIGENAFYGCSSLTSLNIPDTVQYIGELAFFDNAAVTAIKIPVGLFDYCAQNAFVGTDITSIEVDHSHIECVEIDGTLYSEDMTMLVKYGGDASVTSFSVPDTVKYIAECAFKDASLEDIVLPADLEKIGVGAFCNCDAITSIEIPQGVSYIGDYAFADCDGLEGFAFDCEVKNYEYSGIFDSCDSLKEISFLSRISSMNRTMFFDCPALESINIDGNGEYYSVDGVLYVYTSYEQLSFYPRGKKDKEFTLPTSVRYINAKAFLNNEHLEKLILEGNSLVSIAEEAFLGARSLSEVEINCSSLTNIDERAFKDCISLKEIVLSNYIMSIGASAFEGCVSLERAVLGNNIRSIFENTFRDCSSLKYVQLPYMIYSIQEGAFMGCTSLESITIPNYCLNIKRLVFEENVQIYYDGTVEECELDSRGWQMFKNNCEDGFYIICTDGKYWHK